MYGARNNRWPTKGVYLMERNVQKVKLRFNLGREVQIIPFDGQRTHHTDNLQRYTREESRCDDHAASTASLRQTATDGRAVRGL